MKRILVFMLIMMMTFSVSYAVDLDPLDDAIRFDVGTEEFVEDDEEDGLIGALHLFEEEAELRVDSGHYGNGTGTAGGGTDRDYRVLEAQVHIVTSDEDYFPTYVSGRPKTSQFEYEPDVDAYEGERVIFNLNNDDENYLEDDFDDFMIAAHIVVITEEEYEDVLDDYEDADIDSDTTIKEFIMMKKEEIEEAYLAYLVVEGLNEEDFEIEEFLDDFDEIDYDEDEYEEYLDEEGLDEDDLSLEDFLAIFEIDPDYFDIDFVTGWTEGYHFRSNDWSSYAEEGNPDFEDPDDDDLPYTNGDDDNYGKPQDDKSWKNSDYPPYYRGNKFGILKHYYKFHAGKWEGLFEQRGLDDLDDWEDFMEELKGNNGKKGGSWKKN